MSKASGQEKTPVSNFDVYRMKLEQVLTPTQQFQNCELSFKHQKGTRFTMNFKGETQ